MRRLLWKEFREKRLWLLALVASTSGLILLGDNWVVLNENTNAWVYLPFAVALLLGASTYTSELGGGAVDFIRSRPVSWKKMLLAKLIVGVGFVIVTTHIALVAFRIVCPAQYLRFYNPIGLAPSALAGIITIGSAYLLGFLCSVVVPSVFGGTAVAFLLVLTCLVEVIWYDNSHIMLISAWSFILRFVGAAVAVVMISRFGLTLPTGWRTARFCAIVLVFTVVGIPLNFTVRDPISNGGRDASWSLSPDGRYAAFTRVEPMNKSGISPPRSYLVRVADGRKSVIPDLTDDDAVASAFWRKDTVAVSIGGRLRMARMVPSGRVRIKSIQMAGTDQQLRQSPDGRYILYAPQDSRGAGTLLTIADLDKMRELHLTAGPTVVSYWWQSNSTIGYMDRVGRHIARVPE